MCKEPLLTRLFGGLALVLLSGILPLLASEAPELIISPQWIERKWVAQRFGALLLIQPLECAQILS